MSSFISPAHSERPSRTVFSTLANTGHTRIYRFGLHRLEIHTHLGRNRFSGSRNRWVSMTLADLIFTNIDRHEVASALWGYRHDSSLTITELKETNS